MTVAVWKLRWVWQTGLFLGQVLAGNGRVTVSVTHVSKEL